MSIYQKLNVRKNRNLDIQKYDFLDARPFLSKRALSVIPFLTIAIVTLTPDDTILTQANTPREAAAPEPDDNMEGIAGALARALGARNKALANDSDHSEDETDDDWSD